MYIQRTSFHPNSFPFSLVSEQGNRTNRCFLFNEETRILAQLVGGSSNFLPVTTMIVADDAQAVLSRSRGRMRGVDMNETNARRDKSIMGPVLAMWLQVNQLEAQIAGRSVMNGFS